MGEQKTVLVVEDDDNIRKVLKLLLESKYNYQVLEAPSGTSAIALIRNRKPKLDAAVLDIMMKGHGGSVAEVIRKTPEYQGVKIIYHTALSKEQFDNSILRGAHYIQKSRDSVSRVSELINRLLG